MPYRRCRGPGGGNKLQNRGGPRRRNFNPPPHKHHTWDKTTGCPAPRRRHWHRCKEGSHLLCACTFGASDCLAGGFPWRADREGLVCQLWRACHRFSITVLGQSPFHAATISFPRISESTIVKKMHCPMTSLRGRFLMLPMCQAKLIFQTFQSTPRFEYLISCNQLFLPVKMFPKTCVSPYTFLPYMCWTLS